ncbi:MAG: aconitate hydratase AcnA [Rickettsiales bacterium]|nr:aconitate hydratase AcnA [Rickettsiales bacterium]
MKIHPITSNFVDSLKIVNEKFQYISLSKAEKYFDFKISELPFSYRILLENVLRKFDDSTITVKDVKNLITLKSGKEIFFSPSRVLMQDYTGVPAIADLAAMRDKVKNEGFDPKIINPVVPVSLVIDHSISVDSFATSKSLEENVKIEYLRNSERYKLLKWAQSSLKNFKLFPPGSGICHQINLEYLTEVVSKKNNFLFCDSVVGTDSHTTMVNALSILGWGVGGIEAEAVMLGQPISMQLPEVIGIKISGKLNEGITATDTVLFLTEKLRKLNVVGKFVEFFGPGLKNLNLSERSTISNMAPEYGATCGLFPIDLETIKYLKLTGRDKTQINIIEKFSKKQNLWHANDYEKIKYHQVEEINLNSIEHCISGPTRPQDRIKLKDVQTKYKESLNPNESKKLLNSEENEDTKLSHGKVCLAAITSCTNTSNPSVLIMAGLIAKKAVEYGIKIPWWVKTSFAPGSKVVEKYLNEADLISSLNSLGFDIVGFGCTTCIGNSGPLSEKVTNIIESENLNVCSVISGNRNFEGRIHPLIKSNFLASPPLVMLYAIAGKVNIDFSKDELTKIDGKSIYFKQLWPSDIEVEKIMKKVLSREIFEKNYSNIFKGDDNWKNLKIAKSDTYKWSMSSTYIKKPPFLELKRDTTNNELKARPLLILGDSITTDHISPAGVIKEDSVAGEYLLERQVKKAEFNSYGARRGNHEIMVRGTFANIRIKNKMVNTQGGFTKHFPSKHKDEIFKISERYKKDKIPLIVFAGKEYGTGSSRDWAAKGTKLLGIKAVVAESFERIHRSNLVGMGILPLQFLNSSLDELSLDGSEIVSIKNISFFGQKTNIKSHLKIKYTSGLAREVSVFSRIDTLKELKYFNKDGILPFVLDELKN